ncbi:hypothetical protein AB0H07_39185 [Streptomyces sp. NPDC021354]
MATAPTSTLSRVRRTAVTLLRELSLAAVSGSAGAFTTWLLMR